MTACKHHKLCKEDALEAAEKVCAEAGARFTKSRREVFEALWGGHKALTAAEIMEKTGNTQPPMTYRSLEFLKEQGLIHHIASLNVYVGCLHAEEENHVGQMLVCTKCRTVTEVDPQDELKALFGAAKNENFNVHSTHIEMLGLCRACKEAA